MLVSRGANGGWAVNVGATSSSGGVRAGRSGASCRSGASGGVAARAGTSGASCRSGANGGLAARAGASRRSGAIGGIGESGVC